MSGKAATRFPPLLAALLLAGGLLLGALPARAGMELVMVEEAGCSWCRLWHEEIGPIYPKTSESEAAPLRLVDIHSDWPADLPKVKPVHFTPTFILVKDGEEVGRILGYPGEDFFWALLAEMIKKQSGAGNAPAIN
ncbi:transcriptional regulator [Limibacillus halophilus]|jgi:hypothetical protein